MNTIKLVVVGDDGVGKTCMLISYTTKLFPTAYIPSVFDGYAVTIEVETVLYTFGIFDTVSGPSPLYAHNDLDRLRPLAYPQTDVFLVCFSIGLPNSFANVRKKWFPELQHHCPDVPCLLVGTQIDFRGSSGNGPEKEDSSKGLERGHKEGRLMATAEGVKLARDLGAVGYYECSALTQAGLKVLFDEAIAAAIRYQNPVVRRKRKKSPCIVV
ncbi:P-loop containing nucleoside triphosphate hydrolase protein [Mycena alexandri]|uniref:P-loop containing nucleoside triphosphate hydrolase protein n=1 Tax=Mycena alexandri TaxID=1745969 RepID=A0AAD6SEX3_9AGAR|nr:P-loop containing nucleoside triphosphate hydrolase protein [Mycena alexandri]KAJ7030113.1 P-loop containing nucleoside triphosphate hydrolase protein [Mycena alexandri]